MKKRPTTVAEVRSVFALAAEGKKQKDIAKTMGLNISTVSRIIRRDAHANVKIPVNVLEAARVHHPLKKYKKQKKDPRKGVTLDDMGLVPPQNPAMPQAMKDADPAYQSKIPTYEEALDVAHGRLTSPIKLKGNTKAQALMDILASVQHCNEMRQKIEDLRLEAVRLESLVKTKEDGTFARLTALGDKGFSPEFLNSLLTESGLCSNGRFKEA